MNGTEHRLSLSCGLQYAARPQRLLGLGATRYERGAGPDDDFVVLVDPDGNRFCVVD
jgi:hypothetical protein